jgi:hypothetical protein
MPTLLDELKALVEKYGYDPKHGGIELESCWNCGTSVKGLPAGESMRIDDVRVSAECSICSRKFADS